MPVSVCIVTNQWHPQLNAIIVALSSHVEEILLGYDGNPGTIPTDIKAHVKVIQVQWEGYSTTKNKLAAKARNNWILSLDSDEVPDRVLVQSLLSLPYETMPSSHQYQLKRRSYFEGKRMQHGSWGNDKVIRLYNRTASRWDNALVHESLERNAQTKIHTLDGILEHFTADNYEVFLAKSLRYARLSADKYFQNGKKATFIKSYLSPLFSFIKEYVFQAGFLDGSRGWKIAMGNARYTFWKYQFLKEQQA